ncbi:next to BRCA1 gene 1 protein-like isoform X1 [Atheta coriaria]|uniref:next to BRCA1 gene 1 protein-like isoform X1 n=1 Tax=Dalotia coriaria TaxID=877792 RepID=UPI0031F3FB34
MYPKSRDLEIVYNLLWRSRPHQSDDRANIVGMYDIPSTTLNWETFKSYLLKNSGSNATDIKVSYIDSDEKEIAINSQNDFQLALYSFRRRARIGEIITLIVDKVNSRKPITPLIQSSDAEIQTQEYKDEATQPASLQQDDDIPPKWFTKHMKKFKKQMMEDMKQQFALISSKMQNTCQHSHPSRSKNAQPESYKRSRKFEFTKVLDKDMCKKYAFKLDEQRPSQKTKAKKLTAIKVSSDSDVAKESKAKAAPKPMNFFFTDPTPPLNDVILNSSSDKTAGPLYTNSVYLQKWEVTNSGISAWDERTELRYAWGSEKLRPTFTILKCPELQPGEKGEISIWFQIPSTPGSYECFWHFYDCGRRFGRWIGCQLNVIDYPRQQQSAYDTQPLQIMPHACIPTVDTLLTAAQLDPIDLSNMGIEIPCQSQAPVQLQREESKESDISQSLNELVLVETSTNNLDYTSNCEPSSDSDNVSMLSGAQTPHSGSSDYVLIPSPDTTTTANTNEIDRVDVTVSSSQDVLTSNQLQQQENASNNVEVEIPIADDVQVAGESGVNDAVSVASEAKSEHNTDDVEEELREIKMADVDPEYSEYAYIYYNGEKYPFHKDYLRAEYFNEAEKCTPSSHSSGSMSISSKASNEVVLAEGASQACSRQASTSSQESKRLFVFPRHSPGFEVVYPADDASNSASIPKTDSASMCSYEGEEYFSMKDGFQFPPTSESNYYQEGHSSLPGQGDICRMRMSESKEYVPSSNRPKIDEVATQRSESVSSASSAEMSHLAMPHTTATPSMTYTSSTIKMAPESGDTPRIQLKDTSRARASATTEVHTQKFNGRVYRPSVGHPGKRENIMTEAAIMAGTAMGSVRNVVNMVLNTGNGKWVNGHWVAEGENTKRENGLKILAEMGFLNRDLNATLLARYNDDVHRVISELVQ